MGRPYVLVSVGVKALWGQAGEAGHSDTPRKTDVGHMPCESVNDIGSSVDFGTELLNGLTLRRRSRPTNYLGTL